MRINSITFLYKMGYIKFDKLQLINLEYSLQRELLRSNRAGSYASTTIVGCNTRKYHGLLICPMDDLDGENHLILSSVDISIKQHDATFNLGIRKYPGGNYDPKGHKYVRDLESEPIPKTTFRVGGVVLDRENILVENEERIMVRYTLVDAHSPTTIVLKPFLACRNVHKLSKANMNVNYKYKLIPNGIKYRMYPEYKPLYIQISKTPEYVHVPNWYYNVEYHEEQVRGYDYQEDLFVPGYFEIPMKKGDSIIFSLGFNEINPVTLKKKFLTEWEKRTPRNNYENCLINAAKQFVVKRDKRTEIIAGFPWFGRWGRDTFISLPGLTLSYGDVKTCKAVLDTMSSELKDALFPNIGHGSSAVMNSVDAAMWYFWALQMYAQYTGKQHTIWKEYGKKMKLILNGFRNGTHYNIKMQENGLIYAGQSGVALTWMDAVVDGKPVTPRTGCQVEINALWYNAVCFSLEVAEFEDDNAFIEKWKDLPELIRNSFNENFWNPEKKYLADYTNGDYKDWSIRPNQVIATSLPYSPISDEIKDFVLEVVRQVLLTPKGLRTLSPGNIAYKGRYEGNQHDRDNAYHQGTVWPWLLGHFAGGYLSIHGKSGYNFVKKLYEAFEEDMTVHGIGTISEIYDGDPPHQPRGAISQAWSVGELLRIKCMLEECKGKKQKP